MGGVIFRLGVSLKDWGERHRYRFIIRLGLNIREFALQHGKVK